MVAPGLADVLDLDLSPAEAGLESLLALELHHRLRLEAGLDVPVAAILAAERLADLVAAPAVAADELSAPAAPSSDESPDAPFPLTDLQAAYLVGRDPALALGGTGDVTWNPGTVTAGSTVLLTYRVDVTPTSAGQRLVVTGTPASNGTRGTFVDQTGNTSQTRATFTLGPICELAATQGVITHALLERFSGYSEGGRRVLLWETGSEVGSLGFEVHRYDAASGGYRQVGGLVPVSNGSQ